MGLSVCLTTCECPCCHHSEVVYDCNITHNLTKMADAAGLYIPLWRPEECGVKLAKDLIEPLTKGIALMKEDPLKFKEFDAPNGWGLYEHFLPWLEKLLTACQEHPEACVEISR